MNDKITELYKLLNESKDFSGVFQTEDEVRSVIDDPAKVQDFYNLINESEDFKGVFKDVNEFTNTFQVKKKEDSIPNLLENVLYAQKNMSVGNKVSQTPSVESGTRPQQLISEQPKQETTPLGDVLRSLKSGSLRALGGVTGTPSFLNRSLTGFVVRPMVKAMGGTDNDANLALDAIINSTPYGGATLGGAEAQKKLNKKAQQTEEKMRAIEGTIWDNIQQGKLADAGELLGRGFMQSLPYLAMTAATAGGGNVAVLTTLGATSASQQYAELEGQKESRRILNAWLYGGFEAAGELVTAGLTRGIARSFRGTGKPPDPNFIKGLAKEVAKGFGLEGSSEAMTQIGQNLTDIVTGVDEKRNVLEGVLDAFLIGGVTGAGLGILNPTASVVGRTIASDKEIKQVQDNLIQQETLINQIEQTDSDPVKNALKKSVKDLQVQVDEITDKNYQVAQKMTPEQQQQVGELYSVWNQLQDKIDNNEISEADKPAIENTIKGIKDQIQTVKDDLIKAEEERVKAEKEAKVEATKEALKNELDKIAKQKEKALEKVKDVKEGEKVNKKEVDAVKKEFEDKVDEVKAKSDEELTKIEEESKDAERIRDEVKEGSSQEELEQREEVFGKAQDIDKLTPSKDVLGNNILSAEEWNKLTPEERENQETITRAVTDKKGNSFNVDYGIAPFLQRILNLGLATGQSDSGMKSDHPRHRYISGDKEGEIIEGGTYLTFWKPEATVVKETGRNINTQEDIDNIRKAAKEAGFIAYDGNIFFQPSLGINLPATKDGTWRQDILKEANVLTNQRHPELGGVNDKHPSGDKFMEWLNLRNSYEDEIVEKHGGEANFTDRQIADMFEKFVSLLEKYKGGAKETLQSYLNTWSENTLKIKENLIKEIKEDFDMTLQKLKNMGVIKTDCL